MARGCVLAPLRLTRRSPKLPLKAGIAGLEFLRTIPGAIGGALAMNAGCYGVYTADVFESATAITRKGETVTLTGEDMNFAYRSSNPPEEVIYTSAILKGHSDYPVAIEQRMQDALDKREQSQPTKDRTAGSTFRNPAGFSSTGKGDHSQDLMAWKTDRRSRMSGIAPWRRHNERQTL